MQYFFSISHQLHLTFCTSAFLSIIVPLYICRSTHQNQIWMARACQGFGAQRDVTSCRKRESRGKAKQDIFRSVRGAAPLLLSALGGKCTKGSSLSLLLSPLFWPCPALPSLLPSSTPLFLRNSESNSDGCHLAWSAILTATCFPQTNRNSSP